MTETPTEKTLYDGRLLFHQRLNILWMNYHQSMFRKMYSEAISSINGIMTETSDFIGQNKEEEIIKKIDDINNQISLLNNGVKINQNSINPYKIEKELREITREIRALTKSLYLPIDKIESDPDKLFEIIKKQMG